MGNPLSMSGLGFTRDDFERPTKEFSGGWRMRIELAKTESKKDENILMVAHPLSVPV